MCIPSERMVIYHNGHELRIPEMTFRLFGEASTHVVCQFISPGSKCRSKTSSSWRLR